MLDRSAPGPCVLVALSAGCQVAAHLALRAPDRVAALVLIGRPPTMSTTARSTSMTTTTLQKAAAAIGAVFLLVGILGFVPGITSHYSDLELAGHHSGAKLLGIFEVSILHNVVHCCSGSPAWPWLAPGSPPAPTCWAAAAIYLVLFVYGLVVDEKSKANFVPLNTADNWLHLLLGLGMIVLGLLLSRDRDAHRHGTTV